MQAGQPPAVAPGVAEPERVAALDTRQAGVGQQGNLTLEQIEAKPKLADGGAEAVVGASKGQEPEVVASASKASDQQQEDDEGGKSKLSWLKRLTPSISNSSDKDKTKSRDDSDAAPTPTPAAVDPVAVIAPGATETQDVQPTKVVTDNTGAPVPVEVGTAAANSGAPSSLATSIKDELTESHDLDPATSSAKFHSLFDTLPAEEELIEGEEDSRLRSAYVDDGRVANLLSCLRPDYRCALQRDILVQGRLYITERHVLFRANIFGRSGSMSEGRGSFSS